MTTFLTCSPDHYGILYEINPWMSKSRGADSNKARQQWDSLYKLLTETLGITVEKLSPVQGLPDMVFTANAGLVVGNLAGDAPRFFMSRFRHDVRQGECLHYEKWFCMRGFQIEVPPPNIYFEGEGDALWVGERLFLGCQIRTDPAAAPWLAEKLNRRVYPLELVDPRFYHLDTCFCPLDDQRVLYYPDAFSPSSQKIIKEMIPCPMPIEKADALNFGANAIVVQNHLVLNAGCTNLSKTLMDEGLTVHPIDLSEFIKAGGSAKCLILKISDV
ncbi:MAG: amidinotransferase [Nitrospirae bacterium]|nr:amidinotransferase [Candidatus Troglogloeales bacterium]